MKTNLTACLLFLLTALPAHADITIGVVGPLTGQYAVNGEQMKHGSEQAVADINAAGGINGEKLAIKLVDDACDPKQAVAAANSMASAGIKYVIGHYCSGSAIPASKVYLDENMLLISPAATNPKLTDEAKDVIFRVCGRDDRQGAVLASYIATHFKGQKVAIAQDESAYGHGLADEVRKDLIAAGITPVLFEAYTPGQRDYAALIGKLKQAGAQVLFVGGYHTETGLIARQLKEQGITMQLLGGDSLVTNELWAIAGPAAEGLLMSFGPDPLNHPEAKAAVTSMRKAGIDPEGYTLYTYAAMQVLATGLKNAGKTDPLKVAAALRAAPIDTVLGPLKFNAKGDVVSDAATPSYVIYRWHAGKYNEVDK